MSYFLDAKTLAECYNIWKQRLPLQNSVAKILYYPLKIIEQGTPQTTKLEQARSEAGKIAYQGGYLFVKTVSCCMILKMFYEFQLDLLF